MPLKKRLNRRYSMIAHRAGIGFTIPAIFLSILLSRLPKNFRPQRAVFLFDKRAGMMYTSWLFIEIISSAFIYTICFTKKLGEVREMADVKEEVLTYIGTLFQTIKSECSDRNQRATKDKQLVAPKCPYHLLSSFEEKRKEIRKEIIKAELFLVNLLKRPMLKRSPEVSEWLAKK
jgi:hypothetical protein